LRHAQQFDHALRRWDQAFDISTSAALGSLADVDLSRGQRLPKGCLQTEKTRLAQAQANFSRELDSKRGREVSAFIQDSHRPRQGLTIAFGHDRADDPPLPYQACRFDAHFPIPAQALKHNIRAGQEVLCIGDFHFVFVYLFTQMHAKS
jgi:hypothetical protein